MIRASAILARPLLALGLIAVSFPCTSAFAGERPVGVELRAARARMDALRADLARLRAANASAPRTGPTAAVPLPGLDAWHQNGTLACTNPGGQGMPSVTADGLGGAYVAWWDLRRYLGDMYVNRLDVNGNFPTGWTGDGLDLTPVDSLEVYMVTEKDGSNGVFVGCNHLNLLSSTFEDITIQHATSAGAIASGLPANGRHLALGTINGFALRSDLAGGLFLGWVDSLYQTRFTRLDASANVVSGWPAAGIPISVADNNYIDLAADGAGGAFVAWSSGDSVLCTRFAANGTIASGWTAAGKLLASGIYLAGAVGVGRLSSGDAMVAWEDFRSFDVDIYTVRIGAGGSFPSPWVINGVPVNTATGTTLLGAMLPDPSGGAVIAWEDETDGSGAIAPAAQHMTSTGGIAAGWSVDGQRLCPLSMDKNELAVIGDGAGGIVALWTGASTGPLPGVFVQHISSDGTRPVGFAAGGNRICTLVEDKNSPAMAIDGVGGVIVAWEDNRAGGFPYVYVSRILLDGTVGARAALVDAVAEPGVARLHWFDPDGAFDAELERDAGAGYSAIATLHSDGSGHMRYEDRDVSAGGEYRWRLKVDEAGTTRTLGEVTLRIPNGLVLALEPARPNPSAGPLTVAFTVPAAAPARIDLIDVAGRRVLARDLGAIPAGQHVLNLGATLAPGVYAIRLTQGGATVSRRVTVTE